MTKAEASRKAIRDFGETAFAVRVQSKDRNQRFGILVVQNGQIGPLGYGASYEEAFKMAEQTVNAAKAKEIKDNGVLEKEHD